MRVLAGVVVSVFVFLSGCGSDGNGDGGDGGTPDPIPFVDVAVRGDHLPGGRVYLFFDVLAAEDLVSAPDVEIEPPPDVVGMALTETELVLAQDLGDPNADRIFVYDDADLQGAPVTPSVQVLIPLVGTSTASSLLGLTVFDGDAYVLSLQREPIAPPTNRYRWITHVFRDVAQLTNGSTPDATVLHATLDAAGIFADQASQAVNADVLAVTVGTTLHLSIDPATLAGSEAPDTILDTELDLGFEASHVSLSADALYLNQVLSVAAFEDPRNLAFAQSALFTLEGPSLVFPARDGVVETGGRLFSAGLVAIDGPPVVGFDLARTPLDAQPPDVILGVPVVGEQLVAGAGEALITAQVDTGTLAVFDRAGSIQDGDQPDGYLFGDYIEVVEIDAVER